MTSRTYRKPALTVSQQINRLRGRGMRLSSSEARDFLTSVSYYRASAYWYPFRDVKEGRRLERFKHGTHLSNVIKLYEFDGQVRSLMSQALEHLEIAVRTRITYHLAHLGGGAFAHENRANFRDNFPYIEHMSSAIKNVKRSRSTFMLHYRKAYTKNPEHVPIWMLSETMSFGALSKFYKGLSNPIQIAVCHDFGLEHYQKLEEWLGVCSNLRNVCAHHDRLWNRQLKPTFTSSGVGYEVRVDRLFYALLVCRFLLSQINAPDTLYTRWYSALTKLPESNEINFMEEMGCSLHWENFWTDAPLYPS